MSEKSVFLLGPGYIGGQILDFLLQRNYHVTTLTRRESTAAEFHAQGIKTVIGSLDDRSLIQKQVSVSDIVFHTATADHLPSAEAILDGLEERAKNNLQTIYIHTSGASVLSDNSAGAFKSDMVFEDDKPEDIDALPDSAPHRTIDLAIVRRRKILGKRAKIAIMIPPVIYGVGPPGRLSIQLPTLVRYALKHGYAGQVGEGRSVWKRTPPEEVLPNPYWFCENGNELSWNDCAAEIGRVLHQAGKIESPTPRTIPVSNYGDIFGKWTDAVVGTNSRSRANRLRELGWEPKEKKTSASLAEDEIPLIMQETGPFEGYGKVVAS
ncbi:NAD dependent epimerase/dehydratase [Schizosaccharomyces cryophilus OY26]|uniref:NAD dependent epimerase/dehydratase n=1 Tax=Schizosaccharomyces cryophilus (strain OY26 / ATCC MYA-4695 / CBS 11777 / NBRC 106824 / NRRL Y48691) TaxID=653667 RepID=S9XHA5_SCHCR|nr:NAD dependent epimerase/dehydratase [Schizosaccharomyces cryophilus OY26]EPY53056.1 NAD dependent epimerase/dehydratase [Schizosaccharomyces cryophilus OY26]